MGLGGSRGDTEQAIGHLLAIGRWSRRDEHRSAFAAKPETKYLYGAVVWWADTAMNARPTAKPFYVGPPTNNLTPFQKPTCSHHPAIKRLQTHRFQKHFLSATHFKKTPKSH